MHLTVKIKAPIGALIFYLRSPPRFTVSRYSVKAD
jgi:hypothetical protein